MSIYATFVHEAADVALSYFNPLGIETLDEIHGNCSAGVLECREHDDDPALANLRDEAGRVHGAWLYPQKRNGAWVLCHHPDNRDELKGPAHVVPGGMSDQHRRQRDYWCELGERAGNRADIEVPINGHERRIDAVLQGSACRVGVEVQLSPLSAKDAVNRDEAAERVGIADLWTTPKKAPSWLGWTAGIRQNELEHRPPESWTAFGVRQFRPRRCNVEHFSRCPDGNRRHCGNWHAKWELAAGWTAENIAEQMPAGGLARVDTGPHLGFVIASKDDLRRFRAACGDPYGGSRRRPSESRRSSARPCRYEPNVEQLQDSQDDLTGALFEAADLTTHEGSQASPRTAVKTPDVSARLIGCRGPDLVVPRNPISAADSLRHQLTSRQLAELVRLLDKEEDV